SCEACWRRYQINLMRLLKCGRGHEACSDDGASGGTAIVSAAVADKRGGFILSTAARHGALAVAENVAMSSTSAGTTFDEVFDADGLPRAHAQALVAELERLGADSLVAAGALRDAIFMRQGITFDLSSPEGAVADRPFPLDL